MRIGAVLIDIDGVLTVSWRPLPGAVAALRRLHAAGLPLAAALAELAAQRGRGAHPPRAGHQLGQPLNINLG